MMLLKENINSIPKGLVFIKMQRSNLPISPVELKYQEKIPLDIGKASDIHKIAKEFFASQITQEEMNYYYPEPVVQLDNIATNLNNNNNKTSASKNKDEVKKWLLELCQNIEEKQQLNSMKI